MRYRLAGCAAACVLALGVASVAAEEPPHHAPARPAEAPAHPSPPMRPSEPARSAPAYVPRSSAQRVAAPAAAGSMPRTMNGLKLDTRYNHGRYYAPVGTAVRVLPPDHRPYYLGGRRFYFSSGVWYAAGGTGFVVVAAPVGIVVAALPPFYTTVWYGGVPYYYADNTYYAWQPDQGGYAVVNPPDGSAPPADAEAPADASADSGATTGSAPPPSSSPDFVIYPRNGQSKDQQAADDYDCANWAKSQTGFDPSLPDGGVASSDLGHSNYDRAYAACMQGRGYQLN